MHIQRKGNKDKPISEAQQRRNHRIATTRVRIENVFASVAQIVARRCALFAWHAQAASELEGRCLQLAASRLFEGGRGPVILTPEVRADRQKRAPQP
jgi:hypothetical protein